MAILITLHKYILPSASGTYNDECFLNENQLAEMRYLVSNLVKVLEDLEETYWLDYGTLMGATRIGDILPYDGDIDMSRLMHKDSKKEDEAVSQIGTRLNKLGIEGNQRYWKYKNARCDFFRHRIRNGTGDSKIVYPYIPNNSESKIHQLKFLTAKYEFPLDDILPTKKVKFLNMTAAVPNRAFQILKGRYPFTYWMNFPYKWKCWF